MPKVDPNTHEMLTDDPTQDDPDLRGGRTVEDLSSEHQDATPASWNLFRRSGRRGGGALPGEKVAAGDAPHFT